VLTFDPSHVNLFALLHVSIARGKFIESHEYFCDKPGANYFEEVAAAIAKLLIAHREALRVWIT
jgi:hypothetical protein